MLPVTQVQAIATGAGQEHFNDTWHFLQTMCNMLHAINQEHPTAPAMTYKTGFDSLYSDRVTPAIVVGRINSPIERKLTADQAKVVYLALTGRLPVFGSL